MKSENTWNLIVDSRYFVIIRLSDVVTYTQEEGCVSNSYCTFLLDKKVKRFL